MLTRKHAPTLIGCIFFKEQGSPSEAALRTTEARLRILQSYQERQQLFGSFPAVALVCAKSEGAHYIGPSLAVHSIFDGFCYITLNITFP